VIGEEKRVYLLQEFKGTIKRRGRSAGKSWECESPAIKLYNTHTHTHTHTLECVAPPSHTAGLGC